MATAAATHTPEAIVSRWIDAFNARDLNAMLTCLSSAVDIHPLRLGRLDGAYRGHHGVRAWFAQLGQLGHDHRIAISEIRPTGTGHVLVSGALMIEDDAEAGPFCAVHQLADGLIVAAHHYLSDPDLLERIASSHEHNRPT